MMIEVQSKKEAKAEEEKTMVILNCLAVITAAIKIDTTAVMGSEIK